MRITGILPAVIFIALACQDSTQGPVVDVVAEGTTFAPATFTTTATHTIVLWGFAGGPHNIIFEDGAPESGNRSAGTFQRQFAGATSGTHRYRCGIHSTDFTTGMIGSVIVP